MPDEAAREELTEYMAEVLPSIDKLLVTRDVQLTMRPFEATVEFMHNCVVAYGAAGKEAEAPGSVTEFVTSDGFAQLYAFVERWYRDRFGAAMDDTGEKLIFGVVEIGGTPFALRIPTMRITPGTPGETLRMNIPDGVRSDENATSWIEAGPNIDRLTESERELAKASATAVANGLRYIRTSLIATEQKDSVLAGLTAGILPRLEAAAAMLLRSDAVSVQQAYWEMQLACEHALKALAQQQKGTFRQTHDLFVLFDATDPRATFDRNLLKEFPLWKEMAAKRYGVGMFAHRQQGLSLYKATLEVVAGAVRGLVKWGIGQAEFEIARPPWLAVAFEERKAELLRKDEN